MVVCPLCGIELVENMGDLFHQPLGDCPLDMAEMPSHRWRVLGSGKLLLDAVKLALYESSLDGSETVLSKHVRDVLNNAVAEAEGE